MTQYQQASGTDGRMKSHYSDPGLQFAYQQCRSSWDVQIPLRSAVKTVSVKVFQSAVGMTLSKWAI